MNATSHSERRYAAIKLALRTFIGCLIFFLASPTPRAQNAAGLQLILEPSKNEMVIGEPLYATFRLRNTGQATIEVMDNFRVSQEAVAVIAEDEAQQALPYRPLTLLLSQARSVQLAPGGELTALAAIFFGGSGWYIVNREGSYRLHARYRIPTRTGRIDVSSEPVTVSVRPGDGAGRFLIDEDPSGEAAKFLFWQSGDHLQRGIEHLTKIMTEFPESPLSDYIRVALAASYSRSFKNYSMNKLRPMNCSQALEVLHDLRTESLPAVLKVQNSLDRVRCLIASGDRDRARLVLIPTLQRIDGDAAFRQLLEEALQLEPTLLANISHRRAR